MIRKISGLLLSLTISGAAYSYDFTNADNLYGMRGDGKTALLKARDAYEAALPNVSGDDLYYAVSMINKLNITYVDLMTTDAQEHKDFMNHCLDMTKKIKNIGTDHQQYQYQRLSCLGFLYKVTKNPLLIAEVVLLKTSILNGDPDGSQGDYSYEGGGVLRSLAAIASNPAAKPIGLYDLKLAKTLISQALLQPEHPAAPYTLEGKDFYNNYYYQADIEGKMGNCSAAMTIRDDAVQDLEKALKRSKLNGFEVESEFYLQRLKDMDFSDKSIYPSC